MQFLSLERSLNRPHRRHRPARTALIVACLALGVAAWTGTATIESGLSASLRQAATPLEGADLYVSHDEAGLPVELGARIRQIPGVREVRPVLIRRVLLSAPIHHPVLLIGLELAAWRTTPTEAGVSVSEGTSAAFLKAKLLGRKPVLIGRELERALPPETRRLAVLASGTSQRLEIIGNLDGDGREATLGGYVLVLNLSDAARLLGLPGRASRLDLTLEPGADREDVRRRVAACLGDPASVRTPEAHAGRIGDVLQGLRLGFSICGLGALGLGAFLVRSAMAVGVAERRQEIGLLRALGATRCQVWRLILLDAAELGLIGSLIGLPIGWGLTAASLGPLRQALSDVFLPLDAATPKGSPLVALSAVVLGIGVAVLAALGPAARIAAETPVGALRRVEPEPSGSRRTRQAVGLALLACVGLVSLGIGGRVARYGLPLASVLGAFLVVPTLTARLACWLRPAVEAWLGIAGRLAADHLIQSPGRTGPTIAVLAASTALVIQTGGVIGGNESAVLSWIDQGIAGDLFVTSGGPLSASGQILPMPDRLASSIGESLPGSQIVPMRFRYLPWRRDGHATRLLMLLLDAQTYYSANGPRHPPLRDRTLYRLLAEPGTVIVSDNFAARNGLRVGETITLPTPRGDRSLQIIGTIPDYSCPEGTVLVDRNRYAGDFADAEIDVFNVYLPPGSDPESARRAVLQSPFGAEQGLVVLTRDELRGHITGMVHRLHSVAYVQEGLAVVVALLGVLTSLLISVLRRRRELGILRALGATASLVRQTVLAEALLIALIGTAIGLLIGVPLEWYVLRVILFEETGFVFPMGVPWVVTGTVALAVLIGSLLAGLGPASRAARAGIAAAIACE